MPLQVGSRLGHYEVTALIGEGGMGEVYRARNAKLDGRLLSDGQGVGHGEYLLHL